MCTSIVNKDSAIKLCHDLYLYLVNTLFAFCLKNSLVEVRFYKSGDQEVLCPECRCNLMLGIQSTLSFEMTGILRKPGFQSMFLLAILFAKSSCNNPLIKFHHSIYYQSIDVIMNLSVDLIVNSFLIVRWQCSETQDQEISKKIPLFSCLQLKMVQRAVGNLELDLGLLCVLRTSTTMGERFVS